MKTPTPTLKQKVEQYEKLLHKINLFIAMCNDEGIRELIKNADNWSYSHRVSNGTFSDEQQQELINRAFWKLLDTPKTDKEIERQRMDRKPGEF